METPKVVLLGPMYRNVPATSVIALLTFVMENSSKQLISGIYFQEGLYVAVNRNILTAAAMRDWKKGQATHILWVDDDMSIPPDSLEKLLAHEKQVISGLYWGRDLKPCVYDLDPFTKWKVAPDSGLHQIDCAGFGCVLMEIEVLDLMAKHFGDKIWFQTPYIPREFNSVSLPAMALTGEDVYFFKRLKEMGIPAYLDCDVQCGHVGYMMTDKTLASMMTEEDG